MLLFEILRNFYQKQSPQVSADFGCSVFWRKLTSAKAAENNYSDKDNDPDVVIRKSVSEAAHLPSSFFVWASVTYYEGGRKSVTIIFRVSAF